MRLFFTALLRPASEGEMPSRKQARADDAGSPDALKVCLKYLAEEIERTGFGQAAHFVRVAALAVEDSQRDGTDAAPIWPTRSN